MNGDKEFEKFFEENHGDGEGVNPACHQRLMLEVISDRAETVNNMYNATAEFLSAMSSTDPKKVNPASIGPATVKQAESFLVYLMEQAKISVQQSDYLVSRILDGFEPPEEGESDDSKPK
jgi:hypothetical protein